MANNKGFAYAFGWNIFYQKILGICALEGEGPIAKQRAWAWTVLEFAIVWLPQTATLPFLWGDMNAFIECLSTNISLGTSVAKTIVLQSQRRVIGSIVTLVAKDWSKVKTKDEVEVMMETAKIGRFISILSVTLTNIMFLEYVIAKLWNVAHTDVDPNMDPRLTFRLLHAAYFPVDTTNPTNFIILWFGQLIGTWLAVLSYSGPDCFVSMVVLHMCGQLRIVRNSLKNIVDDTTVRDPEKYWRRIASIVKRHEQLNDLTLVLDDTFSSILLVQMLICSVTFCFQGYVLFTTLMDQAVERPPLLDIVFIIIYDIYTITHLFAYCYVGDRLIVESTSIAKDFYETSWYNLAPREAKAFLFVCPRANIPLELRAGKFCTFNMQLFNGIMKNSMGYLSMLIAMKDRLVD